MLIAQHRDPLVYCPFEAAEIAENKVRALRVVNLPVQGNDVVCGKAVFRDEDGQLVAFIDELHVPVHHPPVNDPAEAVLCHARIGLFAGAPVGVVERGIDVEPYKVQRLADGRHILLVGGVDTVSSYGLSQKHRIHPPAVGHEAVAGLHGLFPGILDLARCFMLRHPRATGKRHAHLGRLLRILADHLDRFRVGQHAVAGQLRQRQIVPLEGGVNALHIAVHNKAARLVHGHPPGNTVG